MFCPYHCVEEEETKLLVKTASKSEVGIVLTRQRDGWPRAQTCATHHTRLLHPDGLTRPECQTTRPTCQTRIRMMSSWRKHDTSMHSWHAMSTSSQQTRHRPVSRHVSKVGPTCHVISREPSLAELSRAVLEPSREPRDTILCSGVYVQPDLRLNLGRSSGQNCFWSNLSRLKCDFDDFRLVSS
jgi:hypothetical protein